MEIWFWILGITAVIATVAWVVDRRRGPADPTRPVDFTKNSRTGEQHTGEFHGPWSSGGGGGG